MELRAAVFNSVMRHQFNSLGYIVYAIVTAAIVKLHCRVINTFVTLNAACYVEILTRQLVVDEGQVSIGKTESEFLMILVGIDHN